MKGDKRKSKKARARRRLRVLITAVSVIGVLLFAFLVDCALYYNKVHAGITVAGQSVGGLTQDEATSVLTRLVEEAQKQPITLVSGEKTWQVYPDDVGTKIDVNATVSEAMDVTRAGNFLVDAFHRLKLHFSSQDIALHGSVDRTKMNELIASVAEEIDVPPVNAGLAFEGTTIKVVDGQKGRVVARDQLYRELEALLLALHATELKVPMEIKAPAIEAGDSKQAVAQAQVMISSTLTLQFGESSWELTPEQIAAYMDFSVETQEGVPTLVPYLSADKMKALFDKIASAINRDPINASFKGDGEQAWVVPAVSGRKFNRAKTAEALTAASLKPAGRVAEAVVDTVEPGLTTKEAEAMGIKQKLGSYTTTWEGTPERQINVRITTKYASNVILAPGEIYNFDEQIGPRTAERGYQMAPGIVKGELEDQLGGGICQVATTLFNAAFFAGLEIVERHNHSLYIDHYPKGRDATVSAGGPNLRFRNDTSHYILVRGASDGITTTFVIYGTNEGRKVTYTTSDFYDITEMTTVTYPSSKLGTGTTEIKTKGQTGRSIKVVRTVKAKDGTIIHKDTFVSTWKMIPREILVGTKGATTTTSKSSTTGTTQGAPASTTTTTAVP